MALLNAARPRRAPARTRRSPPSRRGTLARALLALLVIPALSLAGCSNRERSNPLDPRNRATSGSPTGFTAVALSGQVLLSWNASPGPSMQVFRRAEGEADFVPVSTVLPPRNTLFTDSNAPNDVTYQYRLHFIIDGIIVGPPATAEATPSRVVAWVVDAGRGSLIRLSADGREVASEEPGFGDPVHLAVDRARDLVWIADGDAGRVVIYVASLGIRVSVPGFRDPSVIAVDPGNGSAWISDFTDNVVRHVLSSGGPGTPASLTGLDGPLGVDVDAQSRVLWVCERRGSRVRRYSPDGLLLGTVSLGAPSRVATDSANAEAWITSFETGTLWHLSASLDTLHTIRSLQGPVGVAADPRRGRIWVADPVASQVIAFRRDGTEEFRVHGLAGARDLAVELASGDAWVTMTGTVARISPAGAVRTSARGLIAPAAVGLDRVGP
jgi:DNA-binding beta-propeller fold protein YncE